MPDEPNAVTPETKAPEAAKPDAPKPKSGMSEFLSVVNAALAGEQPAKPEAKAEVKAPETKAEEKPPEPAKETKEVKPDEPERKRDSRGKFLSGGEPDGAPAEREPQVAQLRKEYEKLKGEAAKKDEEIARLQKQQQTVANMEELAALKKERDEALSHLKIVDRQRHPEFRREFVEPIEQTVARAKSYVPQELQGRLEAILRAPESPQRLDALENLIGDLPQVRQAAIIGYANTTADLIGKREAALQESSKWYEERQQRDAEVAREKHRREKETWDDEFKAVSQDAADDLDIFRYKEGDDAHNSLVKNRLEEAKSLVFGDGSRRKFVESAFLAIAAKETVPLVPRLRREMAEKLAEKDAIIAKKDKELEDLRGKRPSLSSSSAQAPAKGDFKSAVKSALSGNPG